MIDILLFGAKYMSDRKFRYSEIFGHTIQGEGQYTGRPTVWVRFWGCNFSCMGFGQSHLPKDQQNTTPYKDINPDNYNSVEDLPVFPIGCDSGYSWSKHFGKFAKQNTASEMCDILETYLTGGTFVHPISQQSTHLAFTGGEPMMSQSAMVEILEEFEKRKNPPKFITIETNGTQPVRDIFKEIILRFQTLYNTEFFFSVSPKLSASGEPWEKAIKPNIVKSYREISPAGQIKYVGDGSDLSWEEVQRATGLFREQGIDWDVWIMPVGATLEEQEQIQAQVAEESVKRGYNVAPRVHCWIFGNVVGK